MKPWSIAHANARCDLPWSGVLTAGLVIFWLCQTAMCGEVLADSPPLKVGDYWQFRMITEPGAVASEWSRKITEITAASIRVQTQDGSAWEYDSAMNLIPAGRTEFARILARYPLRVGAAWTFTKKFDSQLFEEHGKASVTAYESITVPAGTFECFRVEAEAYNSYKVNSEYRVWTRWYCPKVKWMAKERLMISINNPFNGGGNITTLNSELIRFEAGE